VRKTSPFAAIGGTGSSTLRLAGQVGFGYGPARVSKPRGSMP
jgi:hypothetical protein